MGRETNKNRRQAQANSVREKAAAARALQQRADQRRRALVVISSIVAVAIVGGVIAIIALNSSSKDNSKATAASQSVLSQVTSVPQNVSDEIGAGSVISAPESVTGGTALDANGKPTLLFIGGEFCPFCAAERWAVIEALSRFGTFSGLQQIVSSEDKISTFTFKNASYTSKYLNFDAKEQADQNRNPLQKLTSVENAQWNKYISPNSTGPGYPFMDFNGKYVTPSTMLDPQVFIGKSWAQIAGSLKDPTSDVAKSVNGAANVITAGICQMTNNAPAKVCTPTITALSQKFPAYSSS